MTKRRPSITAAELATKLQADPEFVARQQEKSRETAERTARLRVDEDPILAELRSVGWDINSVWDLVNTSARYEAAIPVLLKHLRLPHYSDATREGLARALAVPEARYAWPVLVAEYRSAPMGKGIRIPGDTKEFVLGAKDGLAVALSATVTDETIEELIALAKDSSLGSSRVLLLRGIRKSKSPTARRAIEELTSDPALAKEIASWGKERKAR
jgi:hypothetical protein